MVSLFFGLPGCGKSTLLTSFALKYTKKNSRYSHVYSNFNIKVDGVTFIDNECIGNYLLEDCLILIDEATLFADSRAYKEFDKAKLKFFLEHRHFNCDIFLFTQQWDGVDRKIRVITDRVYYVYKGLITGHWITNYYRVPYGIIIPDKNSQSSSLGEIIQGYCKPSLFNRIFCNRIFRPKYYKYFDSFEKYYLPDLPDRYQPYHKTTIKTLRPHNAVEDQPPPLEIDLL